MTHSSQQVEIVLTTYTFWGQHEHCSSLPVSTMVGIQGLPGRDGIGTAYIHTQSSPSNQWVINHNLGYRPTVSLITTGGQEFEAEVLHISLNQAIVYLASALAGEARCN